MIEYDPDDFWGTLIRTEGTIFPKVFLRSMMPLSFGVLSVVWKESGYGQNYFDTKGISSLYSFTTLILGLLLSFRTNFSLGRWYRGMSEVNNLVATARLIIVSLNGYVLTPDSEALASMHRIRRFIVLALFLVKKYLREEEDVENAIYLGLMTKDELHKLQHAIWTQSPIDGKSDRFPKKARPVLICQWIKEEITKMYNNKNFPMIHHAMAVDSHVSSFVNIFQEIEGINSLQLPFLYAQYIKWILVFYMMAFPFGVVGIAGRLTPVACLIMGFVFFSLDGIACAIDNPFGNDADDIDLEKRLRRVDKEMASLMGFKEGCVVRNYDLYPRTRTTDTQRRDQGPRKLKREGSDRSKTPDQDTKKLPRNSIAQYRDRVSKLHRSTTIPEMDPNRRMSYCSYSHHEMAVERARVIEDEEPIQIDDPPRNDRNCQITQPTDVRTCAGCTSVKPALAV